VRIRKAHFDADDPYVIEAVKNKLTFSLQQNAGGSILDIDEALSGVDVNADLRNLRVANVARALFLDWRKRGSSWSLAELDDLEKLFDEALRANRNEPFTHCWYGTFLKEAKGKFEDAEREYREALDLGNKSNKHWLYEHPLFLNNLALLITDEVQLKRREPTDLKEAKRLLENAVGRVLDTRSDFFWPEHNLDRCKTLIEQNGVQ
jgi:tetratricopeptide (TPR) repeat protein